MTYYGGNEMAASFRTVRKNTVQIAEEIPEDRYGFRASPDTRTIAQLLTHMALIPRIQLEMHQSRIDDLAKVDFPGMVGLPDAFLAEAVTMPAGIQPATKSRFEMLLSPKEHEMHHRAQLMTMQRMIGLVPHLTRQMQERMARVQQQARP